MPFPRDKMGQMIMIGLRGEDLAQEEIALLREYPFGGFILFAHNLREPSRILSLCRSLWSQATEAPPLIAIDQEGGRIHRLPKPFTHFPAADQLGRSNRPDLACKVGLAAARELSAVGINLNFAPVLDVNSNPDNPIIGDRSLGAEPARVTEMGWSWIRGLREGGIIPCGKHFPGHGDTSRDSHLELPVVKKDLDALRSVELPPFIHACRNRIESLMTAHVLYPTLDPNHPATLSRKIVAQLLRQKIGYDGVVFGDDLEMKAITDSYALEEAVTLSVHAGVDVLLFCHDARRAVRAMDHLCAAAEKEPRMKARVEKSYDRVRKLKERYLRKFSGARTNELPALIGVAEHQRIVAEIHGSL